MLLEEYLLTALTLGLLGSMHCIGMCGGIVSALTLGSVAQPGESNKIWVYLTAYNVGRITSYAIAGFIAGLLGGTMLDSLDQSTAFFITRLLTGLFLIALGLYLAGWTQFLMPLELAGTKLWRIVQPISKQFVPITTVPKAYLAGLIWGWLPCGLVYSALVWALTSSDAIVGAATMLTFGIATLPALFVSGVSAVNFSKLTKKIWLRRLIGAILATIGILQLAGFKSLIMSAHVH